MRASWSASATRKAPSSRRGPRSSSSPGMPQGAAGPPARRHEPREVLHEAGLREALRSEGADEARPGDLGGDRLERHTARNRVPDRAAAERDAERADRGVARLRLEKGEELFRVLDISCAVQAEEPLGGAVAAGIALERLVAGRREELRRERLHVLMLAAEPVEEH